MFFLFAFALKSNDIQYFLCQNMIVSVFPAIKNYTIKHNMLIQKVCQSHFRFTWFYYLPVMSLKYICVYTFSQSTIQHTCIKFVSTRFLSSNIHLSALIHVTSSQPHFQHYGVVSKKATPFH